jgi:hypothetical protein
MEGITDSDRLKRTIAEGDPFRVELNTNKVAFQYEEAISLIKTHFDLLDPEERARCRVRLAEVLRGLLPEAELVEEWGRILDVRKRPVDEHLLRSYVEAVVALDEDRLFAGLAVLVKDAEHFLSGSASGKNLLTQGELEAARDCFLDTVKCMNVTGTGPPGGGDYERVATDPTLPSGIAASAARAKTDLALLAADYVQTELTVRVGKDFLSRLSERLKGSICRSPDGPYRCWKRQKDRRASVLREQIAMVSLKNILSVSPFWYPLAAYLGTIITRQGIYCFCDDLPRGPDRPPFTIRMNA